MTLERLVVAVDGSKADERILAVAESLSRATGASLRIVSVAGVAPSYMHTRSGVTVPPEEAARFHREVLVRSEEEARAAGAGPVDHLLLEGPPAQAILDSLGAKPPDLLVVGSRGASATRRLFLGSVSNAVVQAAPCPVLVVRPLPRNAPGVPRLQDLAVAVDGSPPSEVAFHLARDLAAALSGKETRGVHLSLLTVLPSHPAPKGRAPAHGGPAPRDTEWVQQWAEEARAQVPEVRTEVYEGSPVERILTYLQTHPTDILVVGYRGLSPTRRVLLGSVSTALINHAPCMVLVAKAPPDRET